MNNGERSDLTLAIESAISGGSLSLLSGGRELDGWVGDDKLSRAEELLPNIVQILERRRIDRRSITRVAVSLGPGSFTGIRIGIATALGLKNSLNIPCVGVSALEAMAASVAASGRVIAALPVGRDLVCSQLFDVKEQGDPIPLSEPAVRKAVICDSHAAIIAPESIARMIEAELPDAALIKIDANLARLIGIAAGRRPGSETLDPLFIQPA
jgi:tRNA threonylcarbamoyladenosine biosynthesis protein TsaB